MMVVMIVVVFVVGWDLDVVSFWPLDVVRCVLFHNNWDWSFDWHFNWIGHFLDNFFGNLPDDWVWLWELKKTTKEFVRLFLNHKFS